MLLSVYLVLSLPTTYRRKVDVIYQNLIAAVNYMLEEGAVTENVCLTVTLVRLEGYVQISGTQVKTRMTGFVRMSVFRWAMVALTSITALVVSTIR